MKFEWDKAKRRKVIEQHGVDFLYAALMFENPVVVRPDNRKDYGESRFIALGHVEGEFFTLVYSLRNNRRRLITAWKAGRNGKKIYQDHIAG